MKSYNGFPPAQRLKAQAWLNAEWAAGRIPRPSKCCACGQDRGEIQAHAEDYSEPFTAAKLLAYPLCLRCHLMLHCRFRHPVAWDRYRASIRSGVTFGPARGFNDVMAQLSGGAVRWTQHERPKRAVLDEIHDAAPSRESRITPAVHPFSG